MSKAKDLRDEFDKQLKELQDNCLHPKSEWVNYMWAPGHFAGSVRICLECDKTLEHDYVSPLIIKETK